MDHKQILLTFWEKLGTVSSFTIQVKRGSTSEKGFGEVTVTKEDVSTLVFQEQGRWGKSEEAVGFKNTLRWSLDLALGIISLEHLRRGLDRPVCLLSLSPTTDTLLSSNEPHLCGEDRYFGKLRRDSLGLYLHWKVVGLKKNEEIECHYSGYTENNSRIGF